MLYIPSTAAAGGGGAGGQYSYGYGGTSNNWAPPGPGFYFNIIVL